MFINCRSYRGSALLLLCVGSLEGTFQPICPFKNIPIGAFGPSVVSLSIHKSNHGDVVSSYSDTSHTSYLVSTTWTTTYTAGEKQGMFRVPIQMVLLNKVHVVSRMIGTVHMINMCKTRVYSWILTRRTSSLQTTAWFHIHSYFCISDIQKDRAGMQKTEALLSSQAEAGFVLESNAIVAFNNHLTLYMVWLEWKDRQTDRRTKPMFNPTSCMHTQGN